MSKKMKVATINHYKQTNLKIQSIQKPTPASNDVLVKIMTTSINPIDTKIMAGDLKLLLNYQMPLILGNDFAGEIVAIGKNVKTYKVGDSVYGRPQKQRIGTFAEYLSVSKDDIALMPKNLNYQEAAAIPLVALTSYQALHDLIKLKPNQKVLIQAGSGGVGTIAIQIAKQLGAYVATTTSPKNFELVKSLGVDEIIDYHSQNFEDVLNDYDAVFDTIGGETLKKSFKIVKPGGQIVSVSGLPNADFATNYGLSYWKKLLLKFLTRDLTKLEKQNNIKYNFLFMKPSGSELSTITKMIENKKVRPIIDRTFEFKDINKALTYSRSGHAKGKIIISIND
ncbi:NADP-dependent oxidoreductase [Companilactobacillus baiquanensis]|uniref:NADP-dependent oxidoreductase n=1 Tax=Companilactobacillus baiquanensis TaxID=2486005 RepID=A0ABW1UWN4_9LACO|nr:NADP-dependent oxidoreductase [Companilactobacillus baiquanensis]